MGIYIFTNIQAELLLSGCCITNDWHRGITLVHLDVSVTIFQGIWT